MPFRARVRYDRERPHDKPLKDVRLRPRDGTESEHSSTDIRDLSAARPKEDYDDTDGRQRRTDVAGRNRSAADRRRHASAGEFQLLDKWLQEQVMPCLAGRLILSVVKLVANAPIDGGRCFQHGWQASALQ